MRSLSFSLRPHLFLLRLLCFGFIDDGDKNWVEMIADRR